MKRILVISDQVVSTLYTPDISRLVGHVDLLLSCGDLPYSYMEFIVTHIKVRNAFFVHGNHDIPELLESGRVIQSPGGWQNIDQKSVYDSKSNLIVAGLEGSIWYKPDAPYQYTEPEMRLRAQRLILKLLFNKARYGRYLDIFVAHSPASGILDGTDNAHRGFKIFLTLIHRFKPRLFVHGHKHHYGPGKWRARYENTDIVNVHPFRIIQLDHNKISYGKFYRR